MFKSKNKQSLAQQLKNKLSFSTPIPKDGVRAKDQQGGHIRSMPPIPIAAEEGLMNQSVKEKLSPCTNGYIDCYGGFFLEHSIMAEFNHLKKTRLPGVYIIPSFSNPLVWYGVVFIRQGTYQDGVFRFTLDIPSNYPDGDCPSIRFTPPIFHPFIDATTGKLDLARGFNSWRANVNHIWQILLYMRRIFYKFDTTEPVNKQAADLYDTDASAFKKKVKEHIAEINNRLYEDVDSDDPHALRFREWNPEIHDKCKEFVTTKDEDEFAETDDFEKPKLSGMSFLEPGTSAIFTKES